MVLWFKGHPSPFPKGWRGSRSLELSPCGMQKSGLTGIFRSLNRTSNSHVKPWRIIAAPDKGSVQFSRPASLLKFLLFEFGRIILLAVSYGTH
ncbi:hypothetical protein TNCT_630711 [Trichonephila clavata]|uniref:Uncharacterized protein n=1 Tax=Trichonephila clavata TaxID=2740835 RepID=A0A8X6KDC9_TRICU|nr:hypothetical protein TNCT_630711 [Trichonephila clavata]